MKYNTRISKVKLNVQFLTPKIKTFYLKNRSKIIHFNSAIFSSIINNNFEIFSNLCNVI